MDLGDCSVYHAIFSDALALFHHCIDDKKGDRKLEMDRTGMSAANGDWDGGLCIGVCGGRDVGMMEILTLMTSKQPFISQIKL